MRRISLLLVLFAAPVLAAQAQLKLGVKAGVSYTTFTGSSLGAYKVGGHGGLVGNVLLNDFLSLQGEALISMKGDQTRDLAVNIKNNLLYLDVPVLLKVHADGLFFEAGPQVGLLLAGKQKPGSDLNTKSQYRPIDLGYVAGLGYQWKSGPNLGLRYNGGIITANDPGAQNLFRRRNSAFQLYGGYIFGGW
ncbi:hypothetical protein GCM10022406_38020 [Hymenobacter algoricola]|uniref:Outer membrane protein beta-barrel domain-containing protein n=2 Tax=Hymenobacter algoricola TaxID=486267 RepID=A0ABP7NRL9_9BACT